MSSLNKEIWTVLKLIRWGEKYFLEKEIDSPRLTLELMLANILKVSRFELYMQFERPLSENELTTLRSFVKRRVAREPLQYILQEEYFYKRKFIVTPEVLIPRPETEILVDEAIKRSGSPLRMLDVGTGSGCIAISIALEKQINEVVAIDISNDALKVALKNYEALQAKNITFVQADFFDNEAINKIGSFDLITSNPPYIAASEIASLQPEVQKEPQIALTDLFDGLNFYRTFVRRTPDILRRGGNLFLEIGFGQAKDIYNMFQESNEFETITTLNDLEKIPRVLWAVRK